MDAEFEPEWNDFRADCEKPGFVASELSIAQRFWQAAVAHMQELMACGHTRANLRLTDDSGHYLMPEAMQTCSACEQQKQAVAELSEIRKEWSDFDLGGGSASDAARTAVMSARAERDYFKRKYEQAAVETVERCALAIPVEAYIHGSVGEHALKEARQLIRSLQPYQDWLKKHDEELAKRCADAMCADCQECCGGNVLLANTDPHFL